MGAYVSATLGATEVTGSGTANTLPVWTGTQTMGNSMVSQNAGATIATIAGALSILGAFTITTGGSQRMAANAGSSSGSTSSFVYSAPAHTNQTASTEAIGYSFSSQTRQFATGALTTQREYVFAVPTYGFVGASTITNAATVAIAGVPAAGPNATITNAHALWIQAGTTRFEDAVLWRTGTAVVASEYSIQRDNLATNELVFNIPTGAKYRFDQNAVAILALDTTVGLVFNQNNVGTSGYLSVEGLYSEISAYTNSSTVYFNAGTTNPGTISINHSSKTMTFGGMLSTSATGAVFQFNGAAHTTLTASTEKIGANFNFSQTIQWATGALATQRQFVITAPTYAFVGASVLTSAATLAISAAPIAGANATITNTYSLWAQAGNARFDGALLCGGATAPSDVTDIFLGRKDQNSNTRVTVANTTAGTAALAAITATISSTIATQVSLSALSSSYSTSGMFVANTGVIFSNMVGGLNMGTFNTTQFSIWTNNLQRISVTSAGRTFFGGSTTATALIHIAAGTVTASTSPLKFTSGTNLTAAEAGAMEYNGTNLFFTRVATRQTVLTANVIATEVIVSDTSITVNIAGTDYKLLARA